MKKFLLTAIAAAAVAATALPAAAAPPHRGDHGAPRGQSYGRVALQRINAQEANLTRQITAGQQRRALTAGEARNLRSSLNSIERLEHQYLARGRDLTRTEADVLERKLDILAGQVRQQSRDAERGGRGGPRHG
jgi:opacity protein-like surface antigen